MTLAAVDQASIRIGDNLVTLPLATDKYATLDARGEVKMHDLPAATPLAALASRAAADTNVLLVTLMQPQIKLGPYRAREPRRSCLRANCDS